MVLLTLSSRINKIVGPTLLRYGLLARYRLGGGVIRDSPILDNILLITFAQRLLSLEMQQETHDTLKQAQKKPTRFEAWAERTFDRIFGADPQMKDPSQKHDNYIDTNDIHKIRMSILNTYLRPILVPNETFADVMRWQFHQRFLKWARTEYLVARYGNDLQEAFHAFPRLRLSPQLSGSSSKRRLQSLFGVKSTRLKDNDDDSELEYELPKCSTVRKAFRMQNWSRRKNVNAGWKRLNHLTEQLDGQVAEPHKGIRVAIVDPRADVSSLSIENLLEISGGHVASCGPFNLLCEECDIYQLWTKEYIDTLASYLLKRCMKEDTVILDVGAGDGLLAHVLQQNMQQKVRAGSRGNSRTPPRVVATDDGSWKILTAPHSSVERLSVDQAVSKYAASQQLIVLCSWMPMGEDWSAIFRVHNVAEYILIGEHDDGNCGDNWATWGNVDYRPVEDNDSSPIPIYEREGYIRIDMEDLSQFQFARFDSSGSATSKTVVFRRQRK
jgi:hypothetical protein